MGILIRNDRILYRKTVNYVVKQLMNDDIVKSEISNKKITSQYLFTYHRDDIDKIVFDSIDKNKSLDEVYQFSRGMVINYIKEIEKPKAYATKMLINGDIDFSNKDIYDCHVCYPEFCPDHDWCHDHLDCNLP